MRLTLSEWQQRWVSTALWALSVLGLTLLIVAFYPSVRQDTSLNDLYSGLTPAVQALLGGADLVSGVGYLNTQLFAFFLPAVLLVLGLGRAATTVAGEEEERTLDLLLAQPVSRRSLYVQKSCAVAVWLLVVTLFVWLPLAVFDSVVQLDVGLSALAAACTQLFLMCLALAASCQAIAAAVGRRATGLAVVVGYTVLAYVVNGLADAVEWLQPLRPLSCWHWYLGNSPLSTGFGGREVLILALATVVATVIGAELFQRRDLTA